MAASDLLDVFQIERLPWRRAHGVLDAYAMGQTIEVRSTAQHIVVSISVESDGESFDTADDWSGWLITPPP